MDANFPYALYQLLLSCIGPLALSYALSTSIHIWETCSKFYLIVVNVSIILFYEVTTETVLTVM